MKKIGFTIAEVLITMAILGIIAATTIPALNNNVAYRNVGPALAKAVSTLEDINQSALFEASEKLLTNIPLTYESESDPVSYLNRVAKYMVGELDGLEYRAKDGITYTVDTNFSAGSCTKDEELDEHVYISPNFGTGIYPNKKYYGKFYPILIDINGSKLPNQTGKDKFLLYVDLFGVVIPAGGQEAVDYGADTTRHDCTYTKQTALPARCTGSIADNGWEYKYR